MKILQKFFSELQRDKVLRSVDICYYFLYLDQKVQFDAKVKEINKAQVPRDISEIKHQGGKTKIEVTPQLAELGQNIINAVPKIDFIYLKFLKAIEDTENRMEMLSDQFAFNCELFREFSNTYQSIEVIKFLLYYIFRMLN